MSVYPRSKEKIDDYDDQQEAHDANAAAAIIAATVTIVAASAKQQHKDDDDDQKRHVRLQLLKISMFPGITVSRENSIEHPEYDHDTDNN
jgi:hypothetical protein